MGPPKESADTLKGNMRICWTRACPWEGIFPRCSFVVFSQENP